MTTWAELNSELSLVLDDSTRASYSDALRLSMWNRAQEFFAVSHTALLKRVTLTTAATDDGVSVALPADFILAHSVKVNKWADDSYILIPGQVSITKKWLRTTKMIPGDSEDNTGYMILPNTIFFPCTVRGPSEVVMWYYAFYNKVAGDTTILAVPEWSIWPLIHLTISYILIPAAVGVADLRRFETKRDAGSPEENSSRAQAKYHMQQYQDFIGRFKGQDREVMDFER